LQELNPVNEVAVENQITSAMVPVADSSSSATT